MPLLQQQRFIAAYLRDTEVRQKARTGSISQVFTEMDLNDDDIKLLREISLDDLDRAAVGLRDERRMKRETEFKQFVDNLACYCPIDAFFEQYDRTYTDGFLDRPQEMNRFLDFSTGFVLNNCLPEYLIDLLRFCYHYVKVSDLPQDRSVPVLQEMPTEGLQPHHRIKLRGPYKIVQFRYDALWLAQLPPNSNLQFASPQPTELLIQKDWNRFKETQIYRTIEMPYLMTLIDKGAVTVLDLIAHLPLAEYGAARDYLYFSLQRGIIEILA